jgi:hypothetical protein
MTVMQEVYCRLFDAEFHREGIGRLKADAPDVAGESVRVEGLTFNQEVIGSNPIALTNEIN